MIDHEKGTFSSPLGGNEEGVVVGYMDKVDFDYELGAAKGGNTVYPSQDDLEAHQPCTKDCGIVEVEVRLRRVIRKDDFSPHEGQRMVRAGKENGKFVRTVGAYKLVDGKLVFVPDEPQPEMTRYVRTYGHIKSMKEKDAEEFVAFCEKYGLKYEYFHEKR